MIKIFIKDNLFDEDKVLKQSYEWNGNSVKYYLPEGEWIINLNGENIVDTNMIVPEYAQIVLTPKVEAFEIATWVVGAWSSLTVAGMVAYAAVFIIASVAISYIGGLLMNAILGGQTSDSDSQLTETSPTYSWTGASTLPRIGTPIPVLYGTHTLSGNIIQRRIEFEGKDQYLYLLLALCEGKIDDITIDNIKIDNTELSNFTNVEWFFRNGTVNQDVIQYFGDTETPNNMSVKCSHNVPVIRQTIGNAIEAFRVDIQFPNGMFYSNDRGGLDTRSVIYDVEYRKVGDIDWINIGSDIYDTIYHEAIEEGYTGSGEEYVYGVPAWSEQVYVGHGFRVSGAQNTKINVSHRVDNLEYGQYEVRITRKTVDNVNTRQQDDMYIANIGEIIYDDLYYPNIALFGMKIKANDQLSGNDPTISIECTKSDIEVFNESGVSQGFKKLNNPAWVAYDVLTNQDYGAGYGYNRVEYDKLLEWANWNDELVSDGKGGTEKRNLFDGVFDTESNVWDSLAKVATCGRAGMFIKGTKYIPIIDKPSLPVQMFNMGNIKKGSFTTSYIGTEDLATEIEIQFTNKDNDYVKDTLSVMVPEYFNQTDYSNKVTINQIGVTRQSQAYRSGRYFLGCNKEQYRTVSFECGVDSIACSIGDVSYVAHDVPAWGKSGRTVGVGTINSVVIDEAVPLISGVEYTLLLRQNETDVIDKRIFIASSTTTTPNITVSSDFTAIPTEYSIYTLFQSTSGAQLFRITNITRTTEQERKVTAIDYNESLLNDSTTIIPTTSSAISLAPHVTSVRLREHLEIKPTGTLQSFIDFEWTCEGVYRDFDIMISKDNGANYSVIASGIVPLNYSYNATELEEGRQYLFKILPRNMLVREALSLATVIPYTFLGKSQPPHDVTNLIAIESGNLFTLDWSYLDAPLDFKEFLIYYNGALVGTSNANSFEYLSLGLDLKTFTVKSVDTSGNISSGVNVNIIAQPPHDVTNFKVDNAFNIQKILSWDYNKEEDFKSFEIRMGQCSVSVWENAKTIHNGVITQSPFVWDYAGYKEFTLFIKAIDNGGNYSVTADRILFNVGDMNYDNILETVCMQPTWSGTLVNGSIVGGKLLTLEDTTTLYYQNKKYGKSSFYDGGLLYIESTFYSGVANNYVYGRKVPILEYTFFNTFAIGGNVKFNYDIDGDFTLQYVLIGGNAFYSNTNYSKYDGGNMYDDYLNFTDYTKPFVIEDNTIIKWKITSTGGGMEASQFCGICDVEDKYDLINDKIIPIGGIQVLPTKSFYEIQNVLVTLQGQGIPRVTSKNPTGATIQVFNASNVDIGGVADIQYKGY